MEGKRSLLRTTLFGTLWTYASYYSGKVLVFISTVILARLLLKEDFGIAGYALVVIGFLEMLSDLGIGPALIYHREDPEAADTAFWLGLGVSSVLFAATWLVAPLAGEFFNDPRAVNVTRALALTFPISAFGNIHDMLLQKGMAFGRKFVPDLAKSGGKGVVSIALAALGFGAWSLIIGQLAGRLFGVLAYWRTLEWRPRARFNLTLARSLLSYGNRIVAVNLLGMILLNADYLFIGRFLGAAALGVYTLAFRVPELLIMQFCHVIATVIFPLYSKIKEDAEALSRGFLMTTRYVTMVTIPIGVGLALVAGPFVLTLFGERWAEAIPVTRAIAIYTLMLSLAYNAGDVYKAQGRPGILTILNFLRALVLLPALWWAVTGPGTIEAVAWTQALVAFVAGLVNLWVAGRLLHTPARQIWRALQPALLGSTLMAPLVWLSLQALAGQAEWLRLLVGVLVGVLSYGGTLWLLQRAVLEETVRTLRGALGRS